MANDSIASGYLSPSSTNGDLNDIALAKFLQQIVVGIVGLPGPMVRPRWQAEPPNIPDFGTSWAAVGPGSRKRDSFSALVPSDDGSTVVRNRVMEILCSFYGPDAEANSELLAMGLEVPQNRQTMQLSGFNIIGGAGDSVIAPVLLKERWQYRVDVPFTIRQQQQYEYAVLTLESAQATLTAAEGTKTLTESILVEAPAQS
jgi:hypothetical protein